MDAAACGRGEGQHGTDDLMDISWLVIQPWENGDLLGENDGFMGVNQGKL